MIVLGLTGGIAMGKSTVAAQFAENGAEVLSADAAVHGLLAAGGAAVEQVAARFPESLHAQGHIDRAVLGKIVFANELALQELEKMLHPLVARERAIVLAAMRERGVKLAVVEIPLLFETGAEKECNYVATVSAPAFIQRRRALARGLSAVRLEAILARQMPDAVKRKRADFVIHTGLGKAYSFRQVKNIVNKLMK